MTATGQTSETSRTSKTRAASSSYSSDSSPHPSYSSPLPCPNCGAVDIQRFCPACGEANPALEDRSLRGVLRHALHDFAYLDGRIPRTIGALLARPGFLTQEYLAGRRSRYAKPLTVFVVLNVFFFLLQPHTGLLQYHMDGYRIGPLHDVHAAVLDGKLAESHLTAGEFSARFEDVLQTQKKSLLLFVVPIFAAFVQLVNRQRERFYVDHLVFSVHAYTFFLLYLAFIAMLFSVAALVLARVAGPTASHFSVGEVGLIGMIVAVMGAYLFVALRRVYGGSVVATAVRALALVMSMQLLLLVYREVLFWATIWSA